VKFTNNLPKENRVINNKKCNYSMNSLLVHNFIYVESQYLLCKLCICYDEIVILCCDYL